MSLPALISLVTLGVSDVEAATAFYVSLGFPLSAHSVAGEVSFFRTGGALLGLYGATDLRADARSSGAVPEPGSFRGTSLAINVACADEVDAAHTSACEAGAVIAKAPQRTEWGGYHFYFADPDGHLWEVAHNPFWPLDERGLPQPG